MAGIMHKTSRLMAAVLLGCLLAGCGGQLLSHREIVRAVLYASTTSSSLCISLIPLPPPPIEAFSMTG